MPGKLSRFWQELKRRKVLKVIAMYAGGAYVLIELAGNVSEPLHLPEWIPRVLIILSLAGFPLIAILSWVFDITPEGIKKTGPEPEGREDDGPSTRARRSIKLSDIVILVLAIAVCILLYPRIFRHDKFTDIRDGDSRISVVVMPFQNITSDTTFNLWQQGLQNLLITSLSNSEGLSVRQEQIINSAIGSDNLMSYASIEPSFIRDVAVRLNANTVITGNIFRVGTSFRITANLMNAKTEEMYRSFEVNGSEEGDFFAVVDSLAGQIKDFLEIKSLEKSVPVELKEACTTSAEAYKRYLMGRNFHGRLDYAAAIEFYTGALEIDTNFVLPMLYLTYIMGDLGHTEQSKVWANKACERIDRVPVEIRLHVKQIKAMVDKKPFEQIEYISQYLDLFPYSMQQYYTLGWICYNTEQWQRAIDALEKGFELREQIGENYTLWVYHYTLLGGAYIRIGEYENAMQVLDDGLDVYPDDPLIIFWKSICAVTFNDSAMTEECIGELEQAAFSKGWAESELLSWIASCYDQGGDLTKAGELYAEAYQLYPDDTELRASYAKFLISHEIDVDRGIELLRPLLTANGDSFEYQYIFGLALYKKKAYDHAFEVLNEAWDTRLYYDHEHYSLLKELEKVQQG